MLSGKMFMGMSLYIFFNQVTGLLFYIFNFAHVKKKRFFLSNISSNAMNHLSQSKFKFLRNIYFWSSLETAFILFFIYLPYNTIFGELAETGPNYFGLLFIMPCVSFVVFYIISLDPRKQMDLVTPSLPLTLIFMKIACFCAGCCHGIECSFGLYNHQTDAVEIPVQLIEAGLALLIFIFLMFYRKKAKDGTVFPIYLILYSGTRFFSEFLRHEPEILWNLKKYQLLCLVGLVVGILELLIALIFGDKITKIFTKYGAFEVVSIIFSELRFRCIKIKKRVTKRDSAIVHHKKHKKKNQKKAKIRK